MIRNAKGISRYQLIQAPPLQHIEAYTHVSCSREVQAQTGNPNESLLKQRKW